MFGFPESINDWTSKDYLRLFAFVAFYVTVRPLVQRMYTRLGERQREREKKQAEDEKIRQYHQQRVQEKLENDGEGKSTAATPAESKLTTRERRRLERQRKDAPAPVVEENPVVHDDGMPSDEDISDLLA